MPRIPFQRPKKVEWEILSDRYGRLVAEPFEKGYALTVGNSLRRTLLAIVPGAAVSWVRIDGVKSVETKIPGVKENTVDVLLNIKKLAIQVPSGGHPIILFVEQQTTGGYPILANVIAADLASLGQLRPRDEVRFELITLREARELLIERERILASPELIEE